MVLPDITQNIVPLIFPCEYTFGNPLEPPGHICLAFFNIAMFLINPFNNPKVQDLCAFQTQFDIDVFGGYKRNLNWNQMPPSGQFYEWLHSHNPL